VRGPSEMPEVGCTGKGLRPGCQRISQKYRVLAMYEVGAPSTLFSRAGKPEPGHGA
jgi:hypothetical protein